MNTKEPLKVSYKDMNVLYISIDKSLSLPIGTAPESSLKREIAIGKQLENYHIITLGQQNHQSRSQRISDNTIVYPIRSSGMISFIINSYRTGKQICSTQSIDLISTQDPLLTGLIGLLLKHTFSIPLNVQYLGDFLDNPYWLKEQLLHRVLNILGKYIFSRADSVLAITPSLKQKIVENMGIPAHRIFDFPYGLGIDTEHFKNCDGKAIRNRFLSASDEKIVLFVGRLCKQKNIPLLLKAAKKVLSHYPKTCFLIVGEGSEKKFLMQLSSQLGISTKIHFIGTVSYADLPDYYAAGDVVVLPSLYEGWPRVAMEVIFCGKPLITTNGGFLEHDPNIKDFCHIVKMDDEKKLAYKICEVLFENPQTNNCRFRGTFESKFDQDLAVGRYVEAWTKTIKPILNTA